MSNQTEQALVAEISTDVKHATQYMTITTDDEYTQAGEALLVLKRRKDAVETFFAPLVRAARKAHKALTTRRSEVLAPIANADSSIRFAITEYRNKKERERRAAEAEQRRLQQIEADRLLAEAIKAEEENRPAEAAANMAMAEIVHDMKPVAPVAAPSKVAGMSATKVWVAEVVDAQAVPVMVAGMMIRPVDVSLLNTLAKNTKGTMEIPGVRFVQKEIMRVR